MVMDTAYYERVVLKTIASGPYEELEMDPLNKMITEVENVIEMHKFTLCEDPKNDF